MRTRKRKAQVERPKQAPEFTDNDVARAYNNSLFGIRFLEEKASRDEDAEAYSILADVANFVIERVGQKGIKAGEIARNKGPVAPIIRRPCFTDEEIDDASGDISFATHALFEKAVVKAYRQLDEAHDAIYCRANICGDRVAGAALIEFADVMVKKAASLLPVEEM